MVGRKAAAVLVCSALLFGCSGNGGVGDPDPNADPPPDNYDIEFGGSGVVRWRTSDFPLLVYIPALPAEVVEPERTWITSNVTAAVDAWDSIIPDIADVADITTDQAQADLEIHWRPDFGTSPFGRVIWTFGGSTALMHGMELGYKKELHGIEANYADYYDNMSHELGHVLGIMGHSGVDTDLMCPGGNSFTRTLTGRDEEALRWLYRQSSFMRIETAPYNDPD